MKRPSTAWCLVRQLLHGRFLWLTWAVFNRLFPAHPVLTKAVFNAVRDQNGLEIGGPSRVFRKRGILPVYSQAACVDNVNFARHTAWETDLQAGGPFEFCPGRPAGNGFAKRQLCTVWQTPALTLYFRLIVSSIWPIRWPHCANGVGLRKMAATWS